MTATSPTNFVEQGKKLPKDLMDKVKAVNLAASNNDAHKCSKSIFVGIFFDGTGNNRDADYLSTTDKNKRKHSNIVRLYHTFRNEPSAGYFPIYIPGVGTAFPEIGEETADPLGGAAGAGGEKRILFGLKELINAPYRYATSDEKCPTGAPLNGSTYSRTWIKGLPDQLTKALQERKGGKKACQINISVFGFSRGAAQARVFVNWLFEICKYNKGKKQWTLAGIPINLQFLGIFDTVASVGIANISKKTINTGHYSWANKKALKIHPAVKRCVHFVAGHEIRACFPLDSIWRDAKMRPKTLIEVMYPGSHSDVGGGYAPGELGVSLSANSLISIIPGRNMHAHAGNAGVPLKINAYYKSDLIPSDKTLQHFKAYMDATDTKGTVKEAGRKHMAYYFSYRFKYRSQFKTLPFYKNTKNKKQLRDLEINQKHFIARLTTLLPPPPPLVTRLEYEKTKMVLAKDFDPKNKNNNKLSDRHAKEVAQRINTASLRNDIETFLGGYIHDSMAGFIEQLDEYTINKIGFLSFRTVYPEEPTNKKSPNP